MKTSRHDADHRSRTAGATRRVKESGTSGLPEELLSVLLHDLRSPLGAIGMLVDLITTLSQSDNPPDPRQLQLLQEAVTKAQRVMDDAVEIQSVIRGTSTLVPTIVEIDAVVRSSLEKASHAPYFRNAKVDYQANGAAGQIVQIDLEKAETTILCVLEQMLSGEGRPNNIQILQELKPPFVRLRIVESESPGDRDRSTRRPDQLRGRLGSRRLGESRYSLQICREVMNLMGGDLEQFSDDTDRGISIQFPMAPMGKQSA